MVSWHEAGWTNVEAQGGLAGGYAHGWGVDRPLEVAAMWYGEARSRCDGFVLGRRYTSGAGVPQNFVTAEAMLGRLNK